jgi:hypothetical protein
MWSGIIFCKVSRNHHVSTLQKYLKNYFSNKVFIWLHYIYGRKDSVVGTELTRSRFWTPVRAILSRPNQTGSKDHPAFCTMDTWSLSQVQTWGVALTTHPLQALSLSICRATPLYTLCACLVWNGRALPHTFADMPLYVC